MNKKLLRKVQRSILREPKRYSQGGWTGNEHQVSKDGSCGTIGCLAGWACAIEMGFEEYVQKYVFADSDEEGDVETDACNYLDIDLRFDGMSGRLFHATHWHPILKFLFVSNEVGGELKGNRFWRAIAAVVRIEVFIWSNGRV